jgi:hypothetical protein
VDLGYQVQILDENFEFNNRQIQRNIIFYESINRIKYGVNPQREKLRNLTGEYKAERTRLKDLLKEARGEKSKFRPTTFLSAIINGVPWRRIVVIIFCAFLLSGTIDLSQYTVTSMVVSRCYARCMVDIDLVQIYSTIYNIGGNKEQATEKATVDATEMQQEERPEIQEIIENNATNLTEFQGKLLQEIIKQAKEGRINKSKLADILNVERSTIYRNWDSVYSHVQSLNGNLKGAV